MSGWLLFLGACSETAPTPNIEPTLQYREASQALSAAIEYEMADKELPAFSIALVRGQETVWAQGFGWQDEQEGIEATASTVYRVGSVSKLFTDVAVMRLVENGTLDLDVPVQMYLDDFRLRNPIDSLDPRGMSSITLRQLMSHRSGLVREPPVGNYFEENEPPLADTVRSLKSTTASPPGLRTKYSNAGIAVVGYVLEKTQQTPFVDYLAQDLLQPLGMANSAFKPDPKIEERLADADMWTIDGRRFGAPTFQLGMAPAGSLYSTVLDLGHFVSVLFSGGALADGRMLKRSTLDQMWTPQFAEAGSETGYGLGFAVSTLDGRRKIGHGGAIYGFSTQLTFLPDEKLGVVAATSLDATNNVVGRITDYALQVMLAVETGETIPRFEIPKKMSPESARELAGRYMEHLPDLQRDGATQPEWLAIRNDVEPELCWRAQCGRIRDFQGALILDGRTAFGEKLELNSDGSLTAFGKTFFKIFGGRPPDEPPRRWRGLIGEYGWDHNVLYIHESGYRLHALIEWFFDYPLIEVPFTARGRPSVFGFPAAGLYPLESLVFTRNDLGQATQVSLNGIIFKRRNVGTESGETFRIEPQRPIDDLRREALEARSPEQPSGLRSPELTDLAGLDESIRLDIRYASTNNFMSTTFYKQARAFLQAPAAEALVRAHRELKKVGYGLLIHDAYRPWYVTKMFWDATPEEQKIFVANPENGSRHNRGCAVDLTLFDLHTGQPVEMVGGYDEFSDRSFADYPGGTARQRWHRDLLREKMEAAGFKVYTFEWWHFDYRDWEKYPVMNKTFEEIEQR